MTLLELLVGIAIIGLMAGIAVAAFPPKSNQEPFEGKSQMAKALMSARAQAVEKRRPVPIRVEDTSGTRSAIALPDGRIVMEAPIRIRVGISGLTGMRSPDAEKTTDGK